MALLSAADTVLDLDRSTLLELMDPMRPIRRADLGALSLKAVVHPGVDGGVVAIISVDEDTDAAIVGAIESSAREAGFEWRAVSEAEFAGILSDERFAPPGTASLEP